MGRTLRHAPLLLAALLALVPGLAGATEPDLRSIDAEWNRLRLASDTHGLDALLLEDFTLTHSDGRVEDKRGYLDDLARGTRVNLAIDNHGVEVRRHGDTAVVTGRTEQHGIGAEGPFRGTFRFTRVWRLHDGAWRLLASHSSRIAEPR